MRARANQRILTNRSIFLSLFIYFVFSICFGCRSQKSGPALEQALRGVDANRDGVRDDLEKLIAEKYGKNANEKNVARQGARALQSSLFFTDKAHAKQIAAEISRFFDCVEIAFQGSKDIDDISNWLESAIINTPERSERYLEFNRTLSGQMLGGYLNPVKCDPE